MKINLHPTNYRPVVFQDTAAKFAFLTKSTASSNETIKWEDGNEYPLIKVYISSASHPFFTGQAQLVDTEGRLDRFAAHMKAAQTHKQTLAKKAKKTNEKPVEKKTKSDAK